MQDIKLAINTGILTGSLANCSPGKIVYARWLTTGNCISRVFVSQNQPNDDMKLLTNYIINVCAWFWFTVKAKPEIYNSHISNDPKSDYN